MTKGIKKRIKKSFNSLRVRLLLVIIAGVLLAIGVYAAVRFGILNWVENSYTTEEAEQERYDQYVTDLQTYIYENALSSNDTDKITEWLGHTRDVYLFLYKDDQLFYTGGMEDEKDDAEGAEGSEGSEGESSDSSGTQGANPDGDRPIGGITVDRPSRDEIIQHAQDRGLHPIEVSDGTIFASFVDLSAYFYYDVANISSIVAALLTLVIVLMLYFRSLTVKISRLAEDVSAVYEVDMNRRIRVADGEDELSALSKNVEQMRSSMLESLKKEKEAIDANTDLITSMSHDIRTPLTVLLGYLDIMKSTNTDENMQDYIKASETTALRLKELSDDMFRYFLVFGSGDIETSISDYDAKTIVEQLLFEHILLLTERGYEVERRIDVEEGLVISTDAPKLMRVIDNIFSNIYKYADKAKRVLFCADISEGVLKINIKNSVKIGAEAESNGVGLRTCSKLCEALGISFEYYTSGSSSTKVFESVLQIPVKRAEEKNED